MTVPGRRMPFRVVAANVGPGMGRIYLGLQDSAARIMLFRLLLWFFLGWMCMVGFGFLISVLIMRGTLKRVDAITTAAAGIGTGDLSSRVAAADKPNDEIARLTRTFNTMLDRISASVNQLRTLADSVAHDMKSPITSVRGSLEAALSTDDSNLSRELVARAVESLDRLSEIVTTSLDVAEAEAGALRLRREPSDLADLIYRVAELYAPAFSERRQTLTTIADQPVQAMVDQRFLVRLLSNLLENELRYAGDGAQDPYHPYRSRWPRADPGPRRRSRLPARSARSRLPALRQGRPIGGPRARPRLCQGCGSGPRRPRLGP